MKLQPPAPASGDADNQRFYGIIIRVYHRDHAPPRFHVFYQGREAKIDIENLELMTGRLPRRAPDLVLDWAELHQKRIAGQLDTGTAAQAD